MSLLKVGIVGLQPGRSWASRAHVPALRAQPALFELHAVANTSLASAQAAAADAGIVHAFARTTERHDNRRESLRLFAGPHERGSIARAGPPAKFVIDGCTMPARSPASSLARACRTSDANGFLQIM